MKEHGSPFIDSLNTRSILRWFVEKGCGLVKNRRTAWFTGCLRFSPFLMTCFKNPYSPPCGGVEDSPVDGCGWGEKTLAWLYGLNLP
jgi:hypothetical protein